MPLGPVPRWAYYPARRVLRGARTIADLAGSVRVERPQIAEALSYRRLDLQN